MPKPSRVMLRLADGPARSARSDLEDALLAIKGVADVMYGLDADEPPSPATILYLGNRLREQHAAAEDAFYRIFRAQAREGSAA